jgi:glycosyltransferase involved in cell wall biosynthesis
MSRVLVIDASVSGHHETYLANIAEGLSSAGHEVVLATATENQGSPAVKRLSGIGSSVTVIFAPLGANSKRFGGLRADISRERAYWQFNKLAYGAAAGISVVDHILLPYADDCIHLMAVMGLPFDDAQVTAITMRPIFHHRHEGVDTPANPLIQSLKQKLFECFLNKLTLKKVLTIDPTLENFAANKISIKATWSKVKYFPDPVKPPSIGEKYESRAALNIPRNVRMVLLYGALDTRKGVEPLLRALATFPTTENLLLVLAGVLSQSIRLLLEQEYFSLIEKGIVKVVDKYISEEEECHLLLACDAVWLGYVGHFSMSGVLVKAAQYGRQVIATKRGLLGRFARDLPGSHIIDVDESEQIKAALQEISQLNGVVPAALMNHNWRDALKMLP